MLALDDLKVVDLGTMVTAPLATMLLGQLGAEVIKIEHPDGGDPFRRTAGDDYSPNFVAYNQNKTSIQADLTTDAGRAVLFDVLAKADILVENFRPGVMEKLGLTEAALKAVNPTLIHCTITGFGADGPYSHRPAYDTVGIALSGMLHLYLDPDKPQILGPTISDNVTGLYAFAGVLAALHARARTGEAQRVELNMLECAIAFIPDAFSYFGQKGLSYGPRSRAASSQCFVWQCNDGKAIAVHLSVPAKFWNGLVAALEADGTLGADARFAERKGRLDHYADLSVEVGKIIALHPRSHWEAAFSRHDIPFANVNSIPEAVDDPQVRHLKTFQKAHHPVKGDVLCIRNPIEINGVHGRVVAPPLLGGSAS